MYLTEQENILFPRQKESHIFDETQSNHFASQRIHTLIYLTFFKLRLSSRVENRSCTLYIYPDASREKSIITSFYFFSPSSLLSFLQIQMLFRKLHTFCPITNPNSRMVPRSSSISPPNVETSTTIYTCHMRSPLQG